MTYIDRVQLVADGVSRGKGPGPGPSAVGVYVYNARDGTELDHEARIIGNATNNEAEYQAVILGLAICARHTRHRVEVSTDSELVVCQVNGTYRIKSPSMLELCLEIKRRLVIFDEVVFAHAPRTNPLIKKADRLANECLEGRSA